MTSVVSDCAESLLTFEANERRRQEAHRLGQAKQYLDIALELLSSPIDGDTTVLEGGLLLKRLLDDMKRSELATKGSRASGSNRGDGLMLAEFMGFVANGAKSGIICVRTEDEGFLLEIAGNALVYAHGNGPGPRFGDLMVELGAIKSEELERLFESNFQEAGEFLGRALLRVGAITEADLVRGIEGQMRNVIERLIRADDVHFTFQPDLSLVHEPVARWNVQAILLEVARCRDEAEQTDAGLDWMDESGPDAAA